MRDSDPAHEVAETHAKAGGILSAFGLVPLAPVPSVNVAELVNDEDVLLSLNARNRRLSRFWLTDQAGTPPDPRLRGKHVVVLDGEDDFVNMLRHVLGVLGLTSSVIRHDEYDAATHDPVLDAADLVIVGPGPGDPRDADDPKMVVMRGVVDRLLEREQPFLAVCLGHQALCHRLGLELGFKDIVFQGTQSPVSIDGRTERVGFYNTFVARTGGGDLPEGVEVEADPGDRRHPPGPRPALPGHPVPRRVDPDPARLRPDPRPGARPGALSRRFSPSGGCRSAPSPGRRRPAPPGRRPASPSRRPRLPHGTGTSLPDVAEHASDSTVAPTKSIVCEPTGASSMRVTEVTRARARVPLRSNAPESQ